MRLHIERGLDLRLKQEEKIMYSRPDALVVLVNNAHTIAHAILSEEPDMLVRVKLPSYLKGTADIYLYKFLKTRFAWLLHTKVVTFPPPIPIEEEFHTSRKYRSFRRRFM
jgi:hypothetical protein